MFTVQAPYAAWRYEPEQLTPRLWLLHDLLDVDQQHCNRTRSDCVLHLRRSEPPAPGVSACRRHRPLLRSHTPSERVWGQPILWRVSRTAGSVLRR